MLNKKTLAVAIAASISTSAFAVQDLNDKNLDAVVIASEVQASSGKTTVTNAGGLLSIQSQVGFGFSAATNRYIRIDLSNAEFETAVESSDLSLSTTNATLSATLLDGGQNGDTFALFQVSSNTAVASTDTFTLAADDLTLVNGEASTATYSIYEGLTEAAGGEAFLKSFSGSLAQFGTAIEKSPILADNATLAPTATVSSKFTEFNNAEETKAIIGEVTTAGIKADVYATDGLQAEFADVYTTAERKFTVTGDFSFVDSAYLSAAPTCTSSTALEIAEDEASAATAATVDFSGVDQYICLEVDGETEIVKGGYSLSLTSTAADVAPIEGTLANVVYDTVSVEVPYITTFSGYNQRFYIVNNGSLPASYSFSFTSEAGNEASELSKAEGVVPAKTMVTIKATDIVELQNQTRTSGVIEFEANSNEIKVTSQTVNNSDGTTDTVVLK